MHANDSAIRACALALALTLAAPVALAQRAGSLAPDFTLTDTDGKIVRLADYNGRFVVLEWTNPDCPFVRSHYESHAMQGQQQTWAARDVVWLSINSTHQGHPEYKSAADMTTWIKGQQASPKAVLIDGTSATARAYAAKTTPQMFVIDPTGTVIYDGAADSHRSASASAHKSSDGYVHMALLEATAGKAVSTPSTTPYGCSVKY